MSGSDDPERDASELNATALLRRHGLRPKRTLGQNFLADPRLSSKIAQTVAPGGGRSVLDIRPLLWKDGWPIAGDNFQEGTYQIQSERSGYALELAVDFVRMPGGMRGFGPPGGPAAPVPAQELADVSADWPAGDIGIRIGDYMIRPHQKWTITPVAGAGGYPGSPYFKIAIAGTDRALAATGDGDVTAVSAFTGSPEQLWRIDQFTDGTYRIMPKSIPGSNVPMVLTAVGRSTATLARLDPTSDKPRWNFRKP